MRIQPISNNNQTQFKAVNKKYCEEALKISNSRRGYGELFFQLKTDVAFQTVSRFDALDTLAAIREFIEPICIKDVDETVKFIQSLPLD